MQGLSEALEKLKVGLGAEGAPPAKKLKGFVAAAQAVPRDQGHHPAAGGGQAALLPHTAATLLRHITVEEAASLFCKFVGKDLTEHLVMRILEAYVPMKVQLAVPGGGVAVPVPVQQGRLWLPASAAAERSVTECAGCESAGRESVPFSVGHLCFGLPPHHCGRQAGMKPGCLRPRYPGAAEPEACGSRPKTDLLDEVTIADVVPLDLRVDIRQEIPTAGGGFGNHEARVKVHQGGGVAGL